MEAHLNFYARGTTCKNLIGNYGRGGESYALQSDPEFSFIELDSTPVERQILHGLVEKFYHLPVLVSTSSHAYIAWTESFSDVGRTESALLLAGRIPQKSLSFEDILNLTMHTMLNSFRTTIGVPRNWQGSYNLAEMDVPAGWKSFENVRSVFDPYLQPLRQNETTWIYRVPHQEGISTPSVGDIVSIAAVLYGRLQQGQKEGKPKRIALVAGQNEDDLGRWRNSCFKRAITGQDYYGNGSDLDFTGIDEWLVVEPTLEKSSVENHWEIPGAALEERLQQWDSQQKIKQREFQAKQREQWLQESRERWDSLPWYEKAWASLQGEKRP